MSSSHLMCRIHISAPKTAAAKHTKRTYIIYFITGNPGLIEYYRTFLTHLYGLLTVNNDNPNVHVFGRSLSGFETAPSSQRHGPPYGLQEQITHSESALEELVRTVRLDEGTKDVRVVLMGHSVGAYIALEIIRRQREKADGMRIVGGIFLFPTVMDIAKSDSGRKSSWLLNVRPFAYIVSLAAKALTIFIPTSFLESLIGTLLSFPPSAASVTSAFIKSPHGVRQALHLARDEMLQITSDTWTDDIWGAAHSTSHAHPRPFLHFLFAKKDHWVANETRDELIKTRGRAMSDETDEVEEWKPRMEIDEEEGWPHGFCIKHSVPVAKRVLEYISDIIEKDEGRGWV